MVPRLQACMLACAAVVVLAAQPRLLSAVEVPIEAPESIHRRACVPFPKERLMQRMLAEATMGHRMPLSAGCSSLEGASCLYDERPLPSSNGAAGRRLQLYDQLHSQAPSAQLEYSLLRLMMQLTKRAGSCE